MIKITISVEAFEAIARTLPLGSMSYETEANERGERHVWLEEVWVNRLGAMRRPDESDSDAILRLVARRNVSVANAALRRLVSSVYTTGGKTNEARRTRESVEVERTG